MLNPGVKYFQNKFLKWLGQKKMTCTQIVQNQIELLSGIETFLFSQSGFNLFSL